MRTLLLTVWVLAASAASAEAPPAPAAAEEEVDLDALEAQEKKEAGSAPKPAAMTRVPEHDYDRRMLALPALLVAILMWNVKWRVEPKAKAKA
jgi:hypothetical protein